VRSGRSAGREQTVLLPFRGLRYDPDRVALAAVTTAPLEPINAAEVAVALSRDQHNIAWLIDPLLAGSAVSGEAALARERLAAWRRDGTLRHDEAPAMYAYEHQVSGRRMLGLIAAVALPERGPGRIVGHEQVSDATVARHVRLLEATDAQPEPVVLVQPASDSFRTLLSELVDGQPTVSFGDGLSEHRLWRLSDPAVIAALTSRAGHQQLLIADGHHRYAAFRRYRDARRGAPAGPWTHGLAMLVDAGDNGLSVDAVHRVVAGIGWDVLGSTPGLQTHDLASQEAADGYLAGSGPPGRCVITDGTTWLAAAPREADLDRSDPGARLAVTHLHHSWLPAWGADSTAVDHVAHTARAIDNVRRSGGLAVLLPSPPLETVFEAARRGRLLPPKSTSFGPKPRIGLVLRHWPDGFDDLSRSGSPIPVRADAAGASPG